MALAAHVERTRVAYPMLYPYPMEPYAAQARFVAGTLEVESNAQHVFQVQKDLARIFGLQLNQVRVTGKTIGGGYGAKSYTKVEPLAAVCARAVGRPVRIVLTLEESMYTSRADGALVEVVSGFDSEGRLLARDIDVTLDTGAYADNSVRVLRKSLETCFGPYRVPALRAFGRAVYTNTTPASSYRGSVPSIPTRPRRAISTGPPRRSVSIRWRCGSATSRSSMRRSSRTLGHSTPTWPPTCSRSMTR